MRIKLLSTRKAIIETREPEQIKKELKLQIADYLEPLEIAIRNEKGKELYRNGNEISIPISFVKDSELIYIRIANQLDKKQYWETEKIKVISVGTESIVFPEESDTVRQLYEIEILTASLKSEARSMAMEIKILKEKVAQIFEGYDIT